MQDRCHLAHVTAKRYTLCRLTLEIDSGYTLIYIYQGISLYIYICPYIYIERKSEVQDNVIEKYNYRKNHVLGWNLFGGTDIQTHTVFHGGTSW